MILYRIDNRWILAFVAILLVISTLLVIVAPEEATMGTGIKVVYVHVALTWAGMLGIVVSGIAGLVYALTDYQPLRSGLRAVLWVAFGAYTLGFLISLVAEQVNWGAIFWDEPRMRNAMNLLALAVVVVVLCSWFNWRRWVGLLPPVLTACMLLLMRDAVSVLHPDSAMRSSASSGIQTAFLTLFVIYTLMSIGLIYVLMKRQASA